MRNKSSLMLMEMLIMLLVFSLCAAICLNTFAKAALIAEENRHRDTAVLLAQNSAEQLKSGLDISQLPQYYDTQGRPAEAAVAAYRLRIQPQATANSLLNAATVQVELQPENTPIFTLSVAWQEVAP